MSIRNVAIDYEPKTEKMARLIEDAANEMACRDYEFVAFSIMGTARAGLTFRKNTQEAHTSSEEA